MLKNKNIKIKIRFIFIFNLTKISFLAVSMCSLNLMEVNRDISCSFEINGDANHCTDHLQNTFYMRLHLHIISYHQYIKEAINNNQAESVDEDVGLAKL